MEFTLVILFSLVFAGLAQKKNQLRYLLLAGLALSLLCGLRSAEMGTDTINYYQFLLYAQDIHAGSDIGYTAVSIVLMRVLHNPAYVLMIYAFVTNYLVCLRLWDFREQASLPYMFLIYLAFYYPYTFNTVRQFLAIAIVFWGTRYLMNKEYSKYLFLNAVAATFHTTALVGVIFLFIRNEGKSRVKKINPLVIIAVVAILAVGAFIFRGNLAKYASYLTSAQITAFPMLIAKFSLLALAICLDRPFHNEGYSTDVNGNLVSIQRTIPVAYIIGLLLSSLGMFYEYLNRIGFFCMMFEMPFWGQTVWSRLNGKFYKLAILVIVAYTLITQLLMGENPSNLFFYKSFLG